MIWVTRAKDNMCFDVVGQQLSEEELQQSRHMYEAGIFVGQQPIVLSDCRIKLAKETSSEKYPDEFRMITACVLQDGKPRLMQFISNQFEWSAYSFANCTSHDGESRCFQGNQGNLYQYLFDRNSDCFCLKISE